MHELKVREIYFDLIKSGRKIYEIRLNDEKRQKIEVGDSIIFKKELELKESLVAEVKDLIYFESFEEMIDILPLEKIGFGGMSRKEIIKIYRDFYPVENEKKYGVVAIKVSVVNGTVKING